MEKQQEGPSLSGESPTSNLTPAIRLYKNKGERKKQESSEGMSTPFGLFRILTLGEILVRPPAHSDLGGQS